MVQAWLAARTRAFRAGVEVVVIDPARRLRSRRPPGPARRCDSGGPLPPDHARKQGGDRGASACHSRPVRSSRPQDRPDVGEPAAAAARPGTLLPGRVGADVELGRVDYDPTGEVPHGVDREEGTPRASCSTAARGWYHHETPASGGGADAHIRADHVAETIETWWPAIEAFLTTGLTNARTEGTNRLIKQVKTAAGSETGTTTGGGYGCTAPGSNRRLSARNPTVPA